MNLFSNLFYFKAILNAVFCFFFFKESGPPRDLPSSPTRRSPDPARQHGVAVVVPIFEKRAPGLYHNSAVILDEGEKVGLYRKMHIPDDPAFYEKFYFTPEIGRAHV